MVRGHRSYYNCNEIEKPDSFYIRTQSKRTFVKIKDFSFVYSEIETIRPEKGFAYNVLNMNIQDEKHKYYLGTFKYEDNYIEALNCLQKYILDGNYEMPFQVPIENSKGGLE